MAEMVQVLVDNVRVNLMSPQRLVVLRQKDAERYLPIWVGPYEAEAITVALQEVEMIRPLTHDLLKNVFTAFGARIVRVEIVSMREDIFFGNIVAEVEGRQFNIDSRPSDAIALAVRAHVPIMVDISVMEVAGIVPDEDLRANTPTPPPPAIERKPAPADDISSDRLSIFEDFLENLDDDKDDAPPSPPPA